MILIKKIYFCENEYEANLKVFFVDYKYQAKWKNSEKKIPLILILFKRILLKMKPYQNQKSSKKKQVEKMFDSISFEYDKLNRLISAGNDVKWRKNIYKIAEPLSPVNILDIATGTADIAIELSQIEDSEIIGLDISEKMLDVGRQKVTDKKFRRQGFFNLWRC